MEIQKLVRGVRAFVFIFSLFLGIFAFYTAVMALEININKRTWTKYLDTMKSVLTALSSLDFHSTTAAGLSNEQAVWFICLNSLGNSAVREREIWLLCRRLLLWNLTNCSDNAKNNKPTPSTARDQKKEMPYFYNKTLINNVFSSTVKYLLYHFNCDKIWKSPINPISLPLNAFGSKGQRRQAAVHRKSENHYCTDLE